MKHLLDIRIGSLRLTLVLLGDGDALGEGRVERGEVAVPELRGLHPKQLARLHSFKEGQRKQGQWRWGDCSVEIAMSIASLSRSHLRDCHFPVEVEPVPPLL